jgi:hypothetical protein
VRRLGCDAHNHRIIVSPGSQTMATRSTDEGHLRHAEATGDLYTILAPPQGIRTQSEKMPAICDFMPAPTQI